MRSSFRVYYSKSGELLGDIMRTGDEEVSRVNCSHNDWLWLRSELPADDELYRAELWVGEQGGYFIGVIIDILVVNGSYDPKIGTEFDLSGYGSLVEGATVNLLDSKGDITDDTASIQEGLAGDYYVVFTGDVSDYTPCLVYKTMGYKGFLTVPIIGDVAVAYQEEGDREITVRYLKEGDDV